MRSFIQHNLFSVLTLLIGTLCTVVTLQYSADSSGFPRAVAMFLAILAAADLLRSARAGSLPVATPAIGSNQKHLVAALLVFASAPAYVVLAKLFDFEIATFTYLVAGMYALGLRNPVSIVAVATGVLLTVKALFFVLLDVTRSSTLIFGT